MQFQTACQFLLLLLWLLLPRIHSEMNLETQRLPSSAESEDYEPRSKRDIYFRNVQSTTCQAQIGRAISASGICDTLASCLVNAGKVVGVCPGNAICCLVKNTCGQIVTTRISYFVSPDLYDFYKVPEPTSPTCEVRIRPFIKTKTCQVHLEFLSLELDQPTAIAGVCGSESFTVTGSDPNYKVPTLCGSNSGQHMFVMFTPYGGEIVLRIKATAKKWVVRITQLPCIPASALPPAGCLQFYNSTTGMVKSFNRGDTISHNLANQNYEICLRPLTGNCSYQWEPTKFDITPVPLQFNEGCLIDDYISVLSAQSQFTNGMTTTTRTSSVICGQNKTPGTTLKIVQTFYSNRMKVFFNNVAVGEGFTFNFFINCSREILVKGLVKLIT